MIIDRSSIRLRARRWCRLGLGLLALLWLAACGVPDQPATGANATPNVVETPRQAATTEHPSAAATVAPEGAYPLMTPPVEIAPPAPTSEIPMNEPNAQNTPPAPAPTEPATEVPMNEPNAQNTPPATAPTEPAADAGPAAGAWQSYRNEQAGYSVEYPAGWTASEQDRGNGDSSVTFTPGGGGSSITVIAQAGEILAEAGEIPNTRCQEITVAGLPARRCTDTISFTTSTTVVGQGKTYIITTTSKRMDVDTYQHFLDSFTITS